VTDLPDHLYNKKECDECGTEKNKLAMTKQDHYKKGVRWFCSKKCYCKHNKVGNYA